MNITNNLSSFLLEEGPGLPGFLRERVCLVSPTNVDFNLLNVIFALCKALFEISSSDISSWRR